MASALINNVDVSCREGRDVLDGQKCCDYRLFSKLGLSVEYMDRAAIEFAKLKPNSFVVCLFPAAIGHDDKVQQILSNSGSIFYSKRVKFSRNGAFNLLRELYLDEYWAGTYPGFGGYKVKQNLCFPNDGDTRIFLVEFKTATDAVKAKKAIRSVYNIGNHSIHINDTHEQTIRVAKLVFNENSIHHLDNMRVVNYTKFNSLLESFKQAIKTNNVDIDDYCITASSVLSVYGLREGNDIDYLHTSSRLKCDDDLITSHNAYGVNRYHLEYHDIIHNPSNHFYHRGIKFASLDVVKRLKEKRGEKKDFVDVELINSIL